MISIGIRVSPKQTNYCILQDLAGIEVLVNDVLITPKSLELPEQLKYMRSTFLDIIYQNKVTRAGLRITESTADADVRRERIEAVLLEMFASCNIEKYLMGQVSNITSKIGIERSKFLEIVKDGEDFSPIHDWNSFSHDSKECILVGIAALRI